MSIKDALAEARIALRRGQKPRAQTILENILAKHPDNQPARLMQDKLLGIAPPKPAPRETVHIPVQAPAAGPIPRVITRKIPFAVSVKGAKQQASKSKGPQGKTPCPICHAKILPGKMKVHYEHYHPSRGTDALDHALSLNDTAGIAMVKASRKKRGGR
jgi:hypothetical protein